MKLFLSSITIAAFLFVPLFAFADTPTDIGPEGYQPSLDQFYWPTYPGANLRGGRSTNGPCTSAGLGGSQVSSFANDQVKDVIINAPTQYNVLISNYWLNNQTPASSTVCVSFTDQGTTGNPDYTGTWYYWNMTGSGTTWEVYGASSTAAFDTTTHISSVVPPNGTTIATSTAATVGASGYLNPDDVSSLSSAYIEIKYAAYSTSQVSVASPDLLFTTVKIPITGTGRFTISTTTPITRGGIYTMQTRLIVADGINVFGYFTLPFAFYPKAATSTKFTAAAPNQFDIFVASTTAMINSYLASSTISLDSCTSWSKLNLQDCLNLMLVPQWQPIVDTLSNFRDGFLSYAPWGYITRTLVIFSSPGTSSITAMDVHVQIGNPQYDTPVHLHYDPNEMLAGASSVLDNIHSSYDTSHSIRDVLEPFVKLGLALSVISYIFWDLINMRVHRSPSKGGHLS